MAGGEGNDSLQGGEGDDRLLGEAGSDILEGGNGADRLNGGRGSDSFVFVTGDGSKDTITDFTDAEDRIDLSGFGGLSFDDLEISAEDADCVIDLTPHGGGRIVLRNFDPSDLDERDFRFAR